MRTTCDDNGVNALYGLCMLAVLAFAPLAAVAQEGGQDAEEGIPASELEDAPVIPATEIEEVVVTGSRIARTPEELAGNLVVLDADFIRASGEATLERVLRQLPQNANSTVESFGSKLNTVNNYTGASTVNLRGLGSESTLVLVDGKRVGYSGFLGGVTDISTIPLALVERIEVLLDGASAVYGSDAVGGVINIITRRDYEGAELDLNYNQPGDGSYDEWRGSISGGVQCGRDPDSRELFALGAFRPRRRGPRCEPVRAVAFPRTAVRHPPMLLRGRFARAHPVPAGRRRAHPARIQDLLSPEDKARAMPETHAVLPVGFNENSSVDDITRFEAGPPNWGVETQAGYGMCCP